MNTDSGSSDGHAFGGGALGSLFSFGINHQVDESVCYASLCCDKYDLLLLSCV